MATTLQNLRDIFYWILRENEGATLGTSAYPLVLCDLLLNEAQQAWCLGTVLNPIPINPDLATAKKGQLPFLNTDKFYSNVAPTYLSADTTVWAVSISVSNTTDFPSTGTLYINGNIIPYTAKTATTFTVSNVLFAHQSGSEVSIVFALPTDFASPIQVIYNHQYKLPAMVYDDVFEQLNGTKWSYRTDMTATVNWITNQRYSNPFYTIIDNQYLVVWNRNNTGDMIHLRYEQKPITMTTGVDATIDNDIYAQIVIPFYAVGSMLYHRWEEQRASELLNFAIAKGKEMYAYYNKTSYESQNWVQYKMQKGGWLNL